ncbi:hypothetical protein ACSDR0_27255 [Streptosporangium sp. G11]|uniref:hypothetical protein n=1 Tax=Streptosporangium sp. G11 TaxID=3436926 RepID=UPI003EBA5FE8
MSVETSLVIMLSFRRVASVRAALSDAIRHGVAHLECLATHRLTLSMADDPRQD